MYLQFLIVFILIVACIDSYFYYAMRQVVKGRERKKTVPRWVRLGYWGYSAFTLAFLLFAMYFYIARVPPPIFARIYITGFIMIVLVSKMVGILFFLMDDFRQSVVWLRKKVLSGSSPVNKGKSISRSTFIKQTGLIVSAVPFVTMMYGVIKSAFDYNVITLKFSSPNIPKSFHGYRIVQISDIHSGSFISDAPLKDAVSIINRQNPDVVFFTGDIVNEVAEEALPFVDILGDVSARHGVFSIMGNHDYGDYFYQKDDLESKQHNYNLITDIHHKMNWDILKNEHRFIEIGESRIGIIGVENWGDSSRFQKYGDITSACNGMENVDFKILLSHDPSHWNALVRPEHSDIDLTLSGHTHGFQLGVEIPGYIKWSPSQYIYDQWAGLYTKGNQSIYVNRGLGFLGYPGRLGILPEITVIELESTQA